MKTVHRDGYYAGSIELSDMINRRSVKCCRTDLVQSRTMRIRTGIIFWNLIFSMMFSCVKGTSLQYFFWFCFIFGSGRKIDCSFMDVRGKCKGFLDGVPGTHFSSAALNAGFERSLDRYSCSTLIRIADVSCFG